MTKTLFPFLFLVGLASSALAGDREGLQRGKASWYHEPQRTATGCRFDPSAMTAAHRTLPFGTVVRVTNLTSQRSALVRINDRGPYRKGRIIDVSRAAAKELRMINAGTATVTLEIVAPES
ncbi:MAG: septal ring lytic transglycosylase RlpA family protein [Chthoniobacteraceae bacterium]